MPARPVSDEEARRGDPDRLCFFTDGVTAIIITILVLELKPPELSAGESLWEGITEEGNTFVAFVISFLLVGMYWVWHRDTFTHVRFVNRSAIWLNLLFLLPLSLIPFGASVLGDFAEDATALHVYGLILVAVTVMRTLLSLYLFRHPGLLWDPVSAHARRVAAGLAAAPLAVYFVAMLIASWWPIASLILYLLVPALYIGSVALLDTNSGNRSATESVS